VANLFDPAGKPFGWAHHAERDHIRKHLAKRWPATPHSWEWIKRESRVTAIQMRLHKYDEPFSVRSRRWAEEQRLRCAREAVDDNLRLTWEELERLIEHFAGANDPISAAIAAKAAAALEQHEEALRESATRATP
jgi:hypothetical protein